MDEPSAIDSMQLPPTDPTGDVDLSILEYNLSLTPAQRVRAHASALALVMAMERARNKRHGLDAPTVATPE